MTSGKPVKKSFNWNYIFLVILVLIAGLLIMFWSLKRPFCANSRSCKESLSLKIENGTSGVFNGKNVEPPIISDSHDYSKKVLGEETSIEDQHIYIDLASQTLKAYEGETLILDTFISSGKWFDTPTGEFKIWEKLRATRMSGGEGNDFYDLPNVPYVMFFEGKGAPAFSGFGLHGAYWHNNFGHVMSHGCVNMRTIDAEKLFNWANIGTKITIYGEIAT